LPFALHSDFPIIHILYLLGNSLSETPQFNTHNGSRCRIQDEVQKGFESSGEKFIKEHSSITRYEQDDFYHFPAPLVIEPTDYTPKPETAEKSKMDGPLEQFKDVQITVFFPEL
tara:strand:+ start:33 stop:374 length:342 start_codon:yes stop_codon:yes gene_type:complete